MDSGTKQKISQVYDKMHVVLWSGLVALLIFFALYTLPKLRAFQLKLQARHLIDIAAEEEGLRKISDGERDACPRSVSPRCSRFPGCCRARKTLITNQTPRASYRA